MDRHALLIGINQYPFLRRTDASGRIVENHDLKGCVNDARGMAQLLCDRFAFPAGQVSLLLDEEATRAGILSGLEALLGRVKDNDLVVLFYAGHGSQMPDREGTKLDPKLDDTLMPYDTGRGTHANRDITDDEIRLWLLRLAQRTPYITLMFDCCHSATMHRAGGGVASDERGILPETRSLAQLPPSPIQPAERALLLPKSDWLPPGDHYVYIAACQARETAREITQLEGGVAVQHGALTHHLRQAIDAAPADATYREICEAAAFALTKAIPRQHPQSEGALDRALFDITAHPPLSYILVKEVSGQQVTLAGGKPRGVVLHSEWVLFPPGCRELGLQEGGVGRPRVRISSVSAVDARGLLGPMSELPGPLWRAVLAAQPADLKWPVALHGAGMRTPDGASGSAGRSNPRDPVQALYGRIESSAWLRLAQSSETPRLTIYLLAPRTEVRPGDPVPQLGPLAAESFVAVDESGELCGNPLRKIQSEGLLQNLERVVKRSCISSLRNPTSALGGKVDIKLLCIEKDGSARALHEQPTDIPVVAARTRLALEISSRHTAELYVSVLQLEADASVKQLYPPAGTSAPLGAQGSGRVGVGEGHPVTAQVPANLPVRKNGQLPTDALVEFVLVASTQPVDLGPLLQDSVRSGGRQSGATLEQLLSTPGAGLGSTRALGMALAPLEDWTTVTRALRVTRG